MYACIKVDYVPSGQFSQLRSHVFCKSGLILPGNHLPIQLSHFRFIVSPLGLYQDPETTSSSPLRVSSTLDSLHRWQTDPGKLHGGDEQSSRGPGVPLAKPQLHNHSQKVSDEALPVNRVSGHSSRLNSAGIDTTSSTNEKDLSGGLKNQFWRSDNNHVRTGHPWYPV